MKRLDRWSSLVWAALAVGIVIESLRLNLGQWGQPGPGLHPFLAGLVMGSLSLVVFIQSFLNDGAGEKKGWWQGVRWGKVLFMISALIVYTFLMDVLGFVIATFLLVAALLKIIEPQGWAISLGGGAVMAIALYVVFAVWLQVYLPQGLLSF
jgi:putative tricarboxylic transport membrane protein